jgi:segregation and condensation protein A
MATVPAGEAPWTIHTPVFEGPLDLLLYLIKRDGIDLSQLRVTDIADSYLEYLDQMRELNLSVASEYLVMASTLIYLKSLELLPRTPALLESGDEEDPRAALLRRIQEFAAYQTALEELNQRPMLERDVYAREAVTVADPGRPLVASTDVFGLLERFSSLLQEAEKAKPTYSLAPLAKLSFEACCLWVLRALGGNGGVGDFRELITTLESKAERVLSFIAVLEMARVGWLMISQEGHMGPVRLEALVDADVDFQLLTGWVEQGAEA